MEAKDRLSLVTSLVAAVAAAHSEGCIHGCITPDNICMSESYEGLIVNFFGRCPSGTEYHLPTLVPTYSAPEALSDAVISKSADVFSLGKLTYKILFGGSIDPYGGWIPSKAYKHQISPMTIGALSKATNGALQRAVALEARDRWPDANAYLHALKGLTIPNDVRNL